MSIFSKCLREIFILAPRAQPCMDDACSPSASLQHPQTCFPMHIRKCWEVESLTYKMCTLKTATTLSTERISSLTSSPKCSHQQCDSRPGSPGLGFSDFSLSNMMINKAMTLLWLGWPPLHYYCGCLAFSCLLVIWISYKLHIQIFINPCVFFSLLRSASHRFWIQSLLYYVVSKIFSHSLT